MRPGTGREAGLGHAGATRQGLIDSREMIKSLQVCAYKFAGRGKTENNYVSDSGVFVVAGSAFAR